MNNTIFKFPYNPIIFHLNPLIKTSNQKTNTPIHNKSKTQEKQKESHRRKKKLKEQKRTFSIKKEEKRRKKFEEEMKSIEKSKILFPISESKKDLENRDLNNRISHHNYK